MKNNQFSNADITRGIELLIQKFCKISIFAHILDGYFEGDKIIITRKTTPLSMVLSELTFHISGQLSRLCFDQSFRDYKTSSICEIYNQIESSPDYRLIESSPEKSTINRSEHVSRFKAVYADIQLIKNSYEEKLKLLADKHYAHLEIRTEDEVKNDFQIFQMSWGDIKNLIEAAKKVLFEINLFWNNSDTDFADTHYDDFKTRFWELIHLPDRDSTEYWT